MPRKKDKGKEFEEHFKEDWIKTLPDAFIYRLVDVMSMYKGVANVCDFICHTNSKLFLVECKSHLGNTWPITFRQYDDLVDADVYKDVYPGVLLWFIDHNKVIWCPISEIKRMKEEGKKSINIKMLKEKLYNIYEVPSEIMRVYPRMDLTVFKTFNYKEV